MLPGAHNPRCYLVYISIKWLPVPNWIIIYCFFSLDTVVKLEKKAPSFSSTSAPWILEYSAPPIQFPSITFTTSLHPWPPSGKLNSLQRLIHQWTTRSVWQECFTISEEFLGELWCQGIYHSVKEWIKGESITATQKRAMWRSTFMTSHFSSWCMWSTQNATNMKNSSRWTVGHLTPPKNSIKLVLFLVRSIYKRPINSLAPWHKCEIQPLVGRKVWTVYSDHS